MRVSTQAAARLRTSSRAGPSSRSDASASTLGASTSPLASRRATGPPPQQMRSCESNTSSPSGAVGEGLQARRQVLAQRPQRGAQHGLLVRTFRRAFGRVRNEAEALDAAEMLALDYDLARFGDRRRHFTLIAQSSYKQCRASIDKPLRQTLVQHIGQPVLDRARALLPVLGALNPVRAVRNVGPCPYVRDACHQRVDVAIEAFQSLDVTVDPVVRQPLAALGEMLEELAEQGGVLFRHRLAEIRHLADFPEQLHTARCVQARQEFRMLRQRLQRELVVLLAHALQRGMRRRRVERRDQRRHRAEIERRVAPLQVAQRIEAVVLDRLDRLLVQPADIDRWCRRCRRSCAGRRGRRSARSRRRAAAASCRPSYLRNAREPDMVHVHVQAHADRVGRDQVVDLARLEHLDLGVARARAERAHHDRRAAALAADQLGDGIDLVGREADHRRAAPAGASPSSVRHRTAWRSAAAPRRRCRAAAG